MNKLSLVIRHLEPRFSPTEPSEPTGRLVPCLLLTHLLFELLSLFLKELFLLLEKVLEIFFCLLSVKWFPLLTTTSAPSLFAPLLLLLLLLSPIELLSISSRRPHRIILLSLLFIREHLISSSYLLEFVLILSVVSIWVIKLSESIEGILDLCLRGSRLHFQILVIVIFRVKIRGWLSTKEVSLRIVSQI